MSASHADLTGLLRAELGTDEVSAAGEHLRGCPVCRDDLAETAVGHALLARSARTLGPDAAAATGPTPSAALVVAASVGAGAQAVLTRDQSPPPQRSAPLQAVAGAGGGTVSMLEASGRTSMTISTHDLPAAHDGQFYYAWLLDPTTNKMLPLGQVGPSGTASFEVSDHLLAAYSAVDVSLEDDDGDPQHSPTSVLRATYA